MKYLKHFDVEKLVFKGSYVDSYGDTQTFEIPGKEFSYTAAKGTTPARYSVSINVIATKDLRSTITGAIYDADGNRVSETAETSFECYATAGLASTSRMRPLLIATLAYSDAADYYFKNR